MDQDELTNLFRNNMNLAPQQREQEQTRTPSPQPFTYSISQHYHHSAHVVPNFESDQEATPVEASLRSLPDVNSILAQHGINSTHLAPPQIELFRAAGPEQRRRLIELWRISSPDYHEGPFADWSGTWQATTLEDEEHRTLSGYNFKTERNLPADAATSVHDVHPLEVHALALDALNAEPYIKTGYEVLAERDYNRQTPGLATKDSVSPLGSAASKEYHAAIDPAFCSREWWNYAESLRDSGHHYGVFEQGRDARHVGGGAEEHEDEEML